MEIVDHADLTREVHALVARTAKGGSIEFNEFEAMLQGLGMKDPQLLRNLFHVCDSNNDGSVSVTEFAELLCRSGLQFSPDLILSLVKAADVNQDGVIAYDEFVPAMLGVISSVSAAQQRACNDEAIVWHQVWAVLSCLLRRRWGAATVWAAV